MSVVQYSPVVQTIVAGLLSAIGLFAIVTGLRTMLAADYQQSLKRLSVQSAQIGQKALADATIAPMLEAAAQLVTAVNQLVRTAVGVGVFLSMGGAVLVLLGVALLPR